MFEFERYEDVLVDEFVRSSLQVYISRDTTLVQKK